MEVNFSEAPEITRSMHMALHDPNLSHLWVIYPADAYQVEKKISVLPLQKAPELIQQLYLALWEITHPRSIGLMG